MSVQQIIEGLYAMSRECCDTHSSDSIDLRIAAQELERLTRELKSAHEHSATYQLEIERLRAALEQARAGLVRSEQYATHWEGCESQHPACAALRIIAAALGGDSGLTPGGAGGGRAPGNPIPTPERAAALTVAQIAIEMPARPSSGELLAALTRAEQAGYERAMREVASIGLPLARPSREAPAAALPGLEVSVLEHEIDEAGECLPDCGACAALSAWRGR